VPRLESVQEKRRASSWDVMGEKRKVQRTGQWRAATACMRTSIPTVAMCDARRILPGSLHPIFEPSDRKLSRAVIWNRFFLWTSSPLSAPLYPSIHPSRTLHTTQQLPRSLPCFPTDAESLCQGWYCHVELSFDIWSHARVGSVGDLRGSDGCMQWHGWVWRWVAERRVTVSVEGFGSSWGMDACGCQGMGEKRRLLERGRDGGWVRKRISERGYEWGKCGCGM